MTVDLLASQPHYLLHLLPIWRALPPELRGTAYLTPSALAWGVDIPYVRGKPPRDGGPILVAGHRDEADARGRRVIYVEHGACQTYVDGMPSVHPSYTGSAGHDRVILFICPNETAAELWRAAYPGVVAVAVGCPALDPWHSGQRSCGDGTGTVAVSFHWSYSSPEEMRSALPHYRRTIQQLALERPVIGHAHPKYWAVMSEIYRRDGIETVRAWPDVLDRASVYVCDNSSTLVEFASTGRPAVALNAPWFRREVEHGGRFWEWGRRGWVTEVNDPAEFVAALDAPTVPVMPEPEIYAFTDGRATKRAVAEVVYKLG